MQGIQPKNNNKGKAQMFVIFLLSSLCGVTLSGLFYGHPHKIDASQVLGPGDKKVL